MVVDTRLVTLRTFAQHWPLQVQMAPPFALPGLSRPSLGKWCHLISPQFTAATREHTHDSWLRLRPQRGHRPAQRGRHSDFRGASRDTYWRTASSRSSSRPLVITKGSSPGASGMLTAGSERNSSCKSRDSGDSNMDRHRLHITVTCTRKRALSITPFRVRTSFASPWSRQPPSPSKFKFSFIQYVLTVPTRFFNNPAALTRIMTPPSQRYYTTFKNDVKRR